MTNIRNFFKSNLKYVILIAIIIIIIIIALIIVMKRNSNEIDVYSDLEYNYFVMYSTENKVGVINTDGEIIIQPTYLDVYIPNPERDVFVCYSSETEYEILNSNGEELFSDYTGVLAMQTSEDSLDFEKYVLRFEQDGKYGLINYDGEIVLEPEYDSIESLNYKPGELLVQKDGKYGVVTSTGKEKIKIEYDSISGDQFYSEDSKYSLTGYIVGNKTDTGYLYGYLNYEGKSELDVKFESITRVLKYDDSSSYLIVMTNGRRGVYKDSSEIISQNYQNIIYAENSNIFVVRRNSNYGIFSISGDEILEVKYVGYSLAGDYISVELDDGTKELYDVNGNKISNLNYTSIQSAGDTNSYIAIDSDGFYYIIMQGETLSNNYTYISYAYDNYFIFRNEEGLYGLLNIYSGVVIEPQYSLMLVVDGTNAIEGELENGTVDIYSSNIEKIISMNNAVVEKINNEYTRIYNMSDIEYIDKDGNIVQNTDVYENLNLYAYKEDDKWGYKSRDGEIIITAEYDFVTELNEYGFAGILKDGKWGVINSNGEIVSDCIHEIETYYLPNFIGEYKLELTNSYHCLELM